MFNLSLSRLAPEERAEGASVFSLSRSIGSSVGISTFSALLTTNTQVNHADISANVTAVNRAFEDPGIAQFMSPFTPAGRAALDALVTQQAQIVAYIDDYKLLLIACPISAARHLQKDERTGRSHDRGRGLIA
jgi:MFS transporter, DHA2 family, multidrug resistance protein